MADELQQAAGVASLFGPVGLGVAAVLSVASFAKSRSAEKHMERAQKARKQITNIKNIEARKQFMRNFYAQQGSALQAGVDVGLESSANLATQANLATRANNEIVRNRQIAQFDKKAQRHERKAGQAQQQAGYLNAAGSFAETGISAIGQIKEYMG